ncbi:MAG: AEC family transporter [Oscillospiraceae bacterium]|jgi:predicted permease|nr:AEC family transporter [Oscillospiraceae bacterium]
MPLFLSNMRLALLLLLELYLIVGAGVLAERIGWFREATARQCSNLLLFVITPCVIVRSFLSMEYTSEHLRGLLISVGCGVLLHVLGIVLSEPFFRGKDAGRESVLHFAAIYGNCGYMALPLAQAMTGSEGVFYCSAVILTFQVFSFTHGAFAMAGGKLGGVRQKTTEPNAPQFQWKSLFLNAGVLSVLVGLPLFLLRAPVPELLTKPVDFIAAMNTPLAMLIFGAYLSRTKFRGFLQNKKIFLAFGVKLFAIPALVMGALLLCNVRGALLNALLISASAPSANNTVVFAAKYGRDPGYAAQVVGVISLLSVLTMPLVIAIGLSIH